MKRQDNALVVSGIAKFIHDKEMRRKTAFRITPEGKGFYIFQGKQVSVDDFNKLFPMQLQRVNCKGENKNKKLGWQDGNKSY